MFVLKVGLYVSNCDQKQVSSINIKGKLYLSSCISIKAITRKHLCIILFVIIVKNFWILLVQCFYTFIHFLHFWVSCYYIMFNKKNIKNQKQFDFLINIFLKYILKNKNQIIKYLIKKLILKILVFLCPVVGLCEIPFDLFNLNVMAFCQNYVEGSITKDFISRFQAIPNCPDRFKLFKSKSYWEYLQYKKELNDLLEYQLKICGKQEDCWRPCDGHDRRLGRLAWLLKHPKMPFN